MPVACLLVLSSSISCLRRLQVFFKSATDSHTVRGPVKCAFRCCVLSLFFMHDSEHAFRHTFLAFPSIHAFVLLGRSGSDNPLAENVAGFFLLKVSLTPSRFHTFGVGEVADGRALVLADFLDSPGLRRGRTGLPPDLSPGRLPRECPDGHFRLSSRPRGRLSTKWQRR